MTLTILNETMTHDFMGFIQYGKNPVQFDTFNSEVRLKRVRDLVNAFCKSQVMRIEEATEDDIAEIEGEVIAGLPIFNVIWADRDLAAPEFSEDEINLQELVMIVKAEGASRKILLQKELKSYAKKICDLADVRLITNTKGTFLSAEEAKVPLQRQIKQAYIEGKATLELSASEYEIHTVRVYVSNLNSLYKTQFAVSVKDGQIVIRFTKPTAQEQALELFKASLLALISAGLIDQDKAKLMVGYVEGVADLTINYEPAGNRKEFFINTPTIEGEAIINTQNPQEAIQATITTTSDPESTGSDSGDDNAVQAVAEDGQTFIVDPNTKPDPEEDEEEF